MADWFQKRGDTVSLTLYVQPGANKTVVKGLHNGMLKIRLAAPPVDGKANDALIHCLAERFDVPQRPVILKSGTLSRCKIVVISGSNVDPASLDIDKDRPYCG